MGRLLAGVLLRECGMRDPNRHNAIGVPALTLKSRALLTFEELNCALHVHDKADNLGLRNSCAVGVICITPTRGLLGSLADQEAMRLRQY